MVELNVCLIYNYFDIYRKFKHEFMAALGKVQYLNVTLS